MTSAAYVPSGRNRKGLAAATMRYVVLLMIVQLLTPLVGAADAPPLRCGSHCLYTVMKRFDVGPQSFHELEAMLGQPTPAGYSMQQLADCASQAGLQVLGVKTTLQNLRERRGIFTCIARLNRNHFVLVADIGDSQIRLIDPPGISNIPASTFQTQWDGNAILISSDEIEPESEVASRLWWRGIVYRSARNIVVLLALAGGLWVTAKLRRT